MSPERPSKPPARKSFKLLVGQIENSPNNSETTFKEMGQHLLAGDAQFNGGKSQEIIRNVLQKRGLLDKEAGFAPATPVRFTGQTTEQEFTFGQDAGQLAGVKMRTTVDQPFGMTDDNFADKVAAEAEKGARLLAQDGKVAFLDRAPSLGEIFRADGTTVTAYVAPNENGEKEFHRVPMAID